MGADRSTLALRLIAISASCLLLLAAPTLAQLRVATWNLTNYSGTDADRNTAIQTALFDEFMGRSLLPDVLVAQEIIGLTGAERLLRTLNADPRGGQDWSRAAFIDGPSTDSALIYRASKVWVRDVSIASPGGPSPLPPRHTIRYDLGLVGYDAPVLVIYSTHMKAGRSPTDRQRRIVEAQAIRADAQALPEGTHIMLLGDFNMQGSSEPAYRDLVESRPDDNGRFFDPVSSPGQWHDNHFFRFLHSQDPVTALDDRFDQILVNDDLLDGDGLEYLGDYPTPLSITTFDDPNHSYRTWGNDGRSFDTAMRIADNQMVGPVIAQALFDAPGGTLGHLPVFLDLLVPARLGTLATLDFGDVPLGEVQFQDLPIGNNGNTELWSARGIQPLRASLDADAPFEATVGELVVPAGDPIRFIPIRFLPDAVGPIEAELRVTTNDPDRGEAVVLLRARVVSDCRADLDGDGDLTIFDFLLFQNLFASGDLRADFDGDGQLTLFDFLAFQNEFAMGC